MTCKPDNKVYFEQKEIYTEQCEVCGLFVKLYKYRSCETRQQELEKQGVDLFKDVRESEKLSAYQTGKVNTNPQIPGMKPVEKKSKNFSRRGR